MVDEAPVTHWQCGNCGETHEERGDAMACCEDQICKLCGRGIDTILESGRCQDCEDGDPFATPQLLTEQEIFDVYTELKEGHGGCGPD